MTRLLEHQIKDVLESEGFAVPNRRHCSTSGEVETAVDEIGAPVYIKAQVAAGDRGRHGGVVLAESATEARRAAQSMLGSSVQGITVGSVLVERATPGAWFGYASVAVEEAPARRVLRFSRTGGSGFDPADAEVAIDLVDALQPHRLRSALVKAGVPSAELIELVRALGLLAATAKRWAAYTLELNPVVMTEAGLVALDAKADLDDYSGSLIPEPSYLLVEDNDPREAEARKFQAGDHRGSLRYVQLIAEDGLTHASRVASHSVGGGESMVVLDALAAAGLEPANYCDTSGSPSAEKVAVASRLVAGQPHIAGLLFSTCIANQPLSVTAEGLLAGWTSVGWLKPTVVRFAGNQSDQAREMARTWAEQSGCPVIVVGEETDEWAAAALLAELLKTHAGSASNEKSIGK